MGTNFNDYAQNRQKNQGKSQDAPLAGIDTSAYKYSSFIYPLDLGAPGVGKDHYMIFHINETSATNFLTRGSNGQFGNGNGPDASAASNLPTVVANQNRDQVDTTRGIYGVQDPQGTSTQGQDGGQAKPDTFETILHPIRRVATTIVLYMPNEITCNYEAEWQEASIGAAAGLTDKLLGKGSWQEVFAEFGSSALKNGGNMLNDWTGLNLKDSFSRQTRLAINNHLEVLFNGIGFRSFNFTFRFTPQNEEEATNVDNIIRAFKFYATPEMARGTAGRFWIYPAEFDLQYISNGQENLFLNKISTCACTSVSVNYTPTGHFAAHRPHKDIQGAPNVVTDIALTFREMEIMTKRRILEGYIVLPPWLLLPFMRPTISQLHRLFMLLTFHKPMPIYIETWYIIAMLSLMALMGKNMWGLLPIHNNVGRRTNETLLKGKGMPFMKRCVNTALRILHLK